VTIVEFSDFECPACGQAFAQIRSFLHDRPDVRFVFRHFPLDSSCNPVLKQALHPDACAAAVAAECAGAQDEFWPYHDQLFTHQLELDRDSLFRYARDVGLDIPRFRTCLDDPATLARVKDDIATGTRVEIQSTPTFFINGRQVDGMLEPPYFDWALMIERHAALP
jgi:protein-disulfide isomerase